MSFGFHGWHASEDDSRPIEVEMVDSMEERAVGIVELQDSHNHVLKRGAGHSRDVIKFFNLPTVDLPFPKGFIIEGGLTNNQLIDVTVDLVIHDVLEKGHHSHVLMEGPFGSRGTINCFQCAFGNVPVFPRNINVESFDRFIGSLFLLDDLPI